MADVSVSNSIYHKSPLDALARRSHGVQHSRPPMPTSPGDWGNHHRGPFSPLLHTSFRTSTSTALSTDDSSVGFPDHPARNQDASYIPDDESVYSGVSSTSPVYDTQTSSYVVDAVGGQSSTLPPSPTPSSPTTRLEHDRHSWASSGSGDGALEDLHRRSTSTMRDTWHSNSDPFAFQKYESPQTQVPKVIVTSPPSNDSVHYDQSFLQDTHPYSPIAVGPTVMQRQRTTLNFSRPLRPSTVHDEASDIDRREHTSTPVASFQHLQINDHSPTARSLESSANAAASSSPGYVRLPNSPPSPRPASRVSLYSTYSFYQLEDEGRASSPAPRNSPVQEIADHISIHNPVKAITSRSGHQNSSSLAAVPSLNSSTTPDEYLALGIQYHEANYLAESATCFERAATVKGGCGVGMLMWGLSLRHAWGTAKDEKAAFRWLRRAAEAAVGDLEAMPRGAEQKAVKTELVFAIYEVGQCFFHGWGVAQDKKMAVSYFQVAARLGDSDAQQELAYCLANGKGCKKDLKEAARWYRAAAAQGASTVGLAWIYKPKYS